MNENSKMLKCGHSNIKLPLIPMFLLWEAVVNTHPAWWPAQSPARIYRSSSGWRSAPAPGTLRRQEKQVRKLGRFLSVGNKPGETASDIISFTSLVVLRMKHLGFYFCFLMFFACFCWVGEIAPRAIPRANNMWRIPPHLSAFKI